MKWDAAGKEGKDVLNLRRWDKGLAGGMDGKKRRGARALPCLLAVALVLGVALPAVSAMQVRATEIDSAKEEKSRLENRKREAEQALQELEAKKSDIVEYIKALDQKQKELEAEIEKLNGEIAAAEELLGQTRDELEQAKETVAEQYDTMKRRIKYMYENGSSDYLEVFLGADDIVDLLNQAEYVAKIAEYDNELLERYKESQALVEQKEIQIEEQLAELAILSEELQVEKETNEKLAADKQKQVEEYNSMIAQTDEQVTQYQVAIEEQDEEIDRLIEEQKRKEEEERRRKEEEERRRKEEEERKRQEQAQQNNSGQGSGGQGSGGQGSGGQGSGSNANANANGQALLNGGLIWPMPASTRITSPFGGREEVMSGSGTFHSGVDIGAAYGSNIIAAAAGTVVAAEYNWSMGNYVLISHGSNIYTVYMHSSQLLVSAGDYVNQGAVIALVGSTGLSTGPHLHFGLKINGNYVNPLNYVSY